MKVRSNTRVTLNLSEKNAKALARISRSDLDLSAAFTSPSGKQRGEKLKGYLAEAFQEAGI